jgi:hypothetical protein
VKITEITVSYGRTENLGNYRNVRPEVRYTAVLEDGDSPAWVEAELNARARAMVEERCDEALEADGQPARYSTEPRYQVVRSHRTYSYRLDAYVDPPLKVIAILPDETRLDGAGFSRVTEKQRFPIAVRRAEEAAAAHDGYTIVDASNATIAPSPEWWQAVGLPPEWIATQDEGEAEE